MTRQSPGMRCIPGLEGDQRCGGGALPVVLVLRVSSHVAASQRGVSLFVLEGSTLQQRWGYETMLDTMAAASGRGVPPDRVLLESLSATRKECGGMAYPALWA